MERTAIEGFELADQISDGEDTCTGCWDNSDHDIRADTNIPKGEPIYLRGGMTDCGMEWDAYCQKCALERAAEDQIEFTE